MSKKSFLSNPDVDKVMRVVISLAQETSILKDRLSLMEILMDSKGYITRDDLQNYQLSEIQREELKKETDKFINNVMQPIVSERPIADPKLRSGER